MRGIIDRFEGEYAVVLVGETEDQQLEVPQEQLPAEAEAGDCLKISFDLDKQATEEQREKVGNLIDKLKDN